MTDTLLQNDLPPEGGGYEFLCTIAGCPKGQPGNGLKTEAGRMAHERGAHKATGPDPDGVITTADINLTATERKLALELETALIGPELILMMINATDGLIVLQGMPKLVTALVLCARKSKELKKALIFLTQAGVWVQLGSALAAIICPILDNHNIVSIPTLRVQDVLKGDIPVARTGDEVKTAARPAPPNGPAGATVRPIRSADAIGPLTGIMPDPPAGMNRAARRAVEGGGDIPPQAQALMDQFGVSAEDLTSAMEQFFPGSG